MQAEREGSTTKAIEEYQKGVRMAVVYMKEHPDMKAVLTPALKQLMDHVRKLSGKGA